jgi:branched-chain amino acid transport system permease protein
VLRLRYFYLALATIGLGIIFSAIVVEARGITGGTLGLAPVPPLDLFGFKIDTYFRQYYLVWIVALLILIFTERALGMRLGRALRAIATSEIAAETLGVRTANWKLVAFVASAIFCATPIALRCIAATNRRWASRKLKSIRPVSRFCLNSADASCTSRSNCFSSS